MSPSLNVITTESLGSGTGIPTGTGTLFMAGATDAGPPPSGPAYVAVQSLNAFVNAFGPRSTTSAAVYDAADEFFHDAPQGSTLYFTRVTDSTATTATLTLNDGQSAAKPTVEVSALTAGAEGNDTSITVTAGTNATFTASATASSADLTSVSSFKNIGVGTPVSGTGIPTGTYISAVDSTAGTATLSQSFSGSTGSVTITPGNVTVTVLVVDDTGEQIADETHGPYYLTSQLFADTSSDWVSFAQSSTSGNTTNLPAALTSTALSGGADASDLTDASHVAALANFPASLGPGQVILPGKVSTTAWLGLLAHGASTNRFAILDMQDSTSASTVAAAAAQLTPGANGSYGMLIQGSLLLPGINGGATRTCAGSAAVAALCAQVAVGNNQAVAPCGYKWPLTYPLGFTTFSGPVPAGSSTGGSFSSADVQTLESNSVPVNVFSNLYQRLCLFGFATTLASTVELIYDQATASRERMALVNDCQVAMAPYLFDDIDLATITNLQTDLDAVGLAHYNGGALYDGGTGQAAQAFAVSTGAPINTPATAQAKQLNAQIECRIVRYADTVNVQITVIPVTVSLPAVAA